MMVGPHSIFCVAMTRLAAWIGSMRRPARGTEAQQATMKTDEAETAAFSPFRDMTPHAWLHSNFQGLDGRLVSTF